MKGDSISKLAITNLKTKFWRSSANVKESLIVYSLVVNNPSIGTKNFASLYVGVLVADKLVGKDGRLWVTGLLNLAKPYIIPNLEPRGHKSFYYSKF